MMRNDHRHDRYDTGGPMTDAAAARKPIGNDNPPEDQIVRECIIQLASELGNLLTPPVLQPDIDVIEKNFRAGIKRAFEAGRLWAHDRRQVLMMTKYLGVLARFRMIAHLRDHLEAHDPQNPIDVPGDLLWAADIVAHECKLGAKERAEARGDDGDDDVNLRDIWCPGFGGLLARKREPATA
jgi:hypothetical protein